MIDVIKVLLAISIVLAMAFLVIYTGWNLISIFKDWWKR